jgi:hypothetical protein
MEVLSLEWGGKQLFSITGQSSHNPLGKLPKWRNGLFVNGLVKSVVNWVTTLNFGLLCGESGDSAKLRFHNEQVMVQ